MGAQLASLALARWAPHLDGREFRVLMRMALTSLDEPTDTRPAGHYFGGRDPLADVLPAGEGTRETAYKTVQRAIAGLVRKGAIEIVSKGRVGNNGVYRMTLWSRPDIDGSPVDNSGQGDSQSPPQGDSHGPAEGDSQGPKRGTPTVPPRNQEEPREELREEPSVDLRGAVTAPRTHASTKTQTPESITNGNPRCPEPTCAKGWILTATGIARCPRTHGNVIPLIARSAPPTTPGEPLVWMATTRRGLDYHDIAADPRSTICGRSTRTGRTITPAAAAELSAKHCFACRRKQDTP